MAPCPKQRVDLNWVINNQLVFCEARLPYVYLHDKLSASQHIKQSDLFREGTSPIFSFLFHPTLIFTIHYVNNMGFVLVKGKLKHHTTIARLIYAKGRPSILCMDKCRMYYFGILAKPWFSIITILILFVLLSRDFMDYSVKALVVG